MIDTLIAFSLRNRTLVVLGAVLVAIYGSWITAILPVDVFPDLNRPTVTLLNEAGGLSPEEVETLVIRPLETAMAGVAGVERIRSQSGIGLGVVWIEFDWDVPPFQARQAVVERLGTVVDQLPEGVSPKITPQSSIMGEILLVGLVSPDGGPELRKFADIEVVPRLQAIPGISQVTALGGGIEQIEVQIHPEALAARGIPLQQVMDAVAVAQGVRTGGFIERQSQESLIRILARSSDPDALAITVVTERNHVPILLGQLATIRRTVQPKRGDAGVNGSPGIILSIQKQPGRSTIELTRTIDQVLQDIELPESVSVVTLFRQADFIEAAIGNVEEALRDGAILVALVLIAFLLSWRTTAITLVAIPLSFLVTAIVLHSLGLSVNTMTLGGLAIAIGELVDDAIVDVENIWRRLQENAQLSPPQSTIVVVFQASREVRSSIVYSTLMIILVFTPLFAMEGMEGRLFLPLGVAYITAILASMLVSLTLTPVLCSWLLTSSSHRPESLLVRQLKRIDLQLLHYTLGHPKRLLMGVGGLFFLAVLSLPFLGTSFLPPFHEGTATINLSAIPGTSLAESARLGTLAEKLLLEIPEIRSVGRRTGRAELDEHAEGVHYTEMDVDFNDDGRPREQVLQDIRTVLHKIPGISVSIGQPISHRLDHLLSGVRAAIAVKLYSEDLTALRTHGSMLFTDFANIPGLVDLQLERQVLIPQVHVQIDRERAARFGIAPGQLADELEMAIAGRKISDIPEGIRAIPLVMRLTPEAREDAATLQELPITLDDGHVVTLEQLATIHSSTGPNEILHENGRRRLVISANVSGRDLGSVIHDIEAILQQNPSPGLSWELGGQFESQRRASRTITWLAAASLVAMIALLYHQFGSIRLTLQILINLPLALIGAIAAVWATGATLSVATLVGFITLCGIASRNSILMITHYLHLMKEEQFQFGRELVIRGSLERLIPVMMTAVTAGIALFPLAFAGGTPGKEILTPVAQVILGGLISSTLLDIVVTPSLFLAFGQTAAERWLRRVTTENSTVSP